jgi:RNA methyltransferase, TrmH family
MISKNKIKFIQSLHLKKYRVMYGKFIAEGPKLVSDIASSDLKITELYALPAWFSENPDITRKVSSAEAVSEEELLKISLLSTPNQVLAIVEIPERNFNLSFAEETMVIALDDIRDPGNLGTIIRIADWFGIKHIVCSENCVDACNPKTVQATMGSISHVNVYYQNLEELLSKANESLAIYGAFLEGNPVYNEALSRNGFLVIGNEANGISPEIEKLIKKKISIPSGNKSSLHVESLNASIATAIICSECNRQSGTF